MNVKMLEHRIPFRVTEMKRDKKTASGEKSKREQGGQSGRESFYLPSYHILFSFIMSSATCSDSESAP